MIKLSIPRSKSFSRMEFPEAVGVIRNLQLHQNNVSFELVAYGDQAAYDLLMAGKTGMPMEQSEGFVFKKYFSTEISKIDEVAAKIDVSNLTPSEMMKACCYEYVKSLANPFE